MRRRILLSDNMVEARLQQHEKLQYDLKPQVSTNYGTGGAVGCWKAEIIGPFDSPFFGRAAFGSDKERTVNALIGRLVEYGREAYNEGLLSDFTRGRGPHTDLVDQDPLSD